MLTKKPFLLLATLLIAGAAHAVHPPQIIQSEQLNVTVDPAFPRVVGYVWRANGAVLYGQDQVLNEVILNGKRTKPDVTFRRMENDRVGYKLDFPGTGISLVVEIGVEANRLSFKVTKITESGSTKVQTLEFPNHQLVSIRSTQPKAALATARCNGEWSTLVEEFAALTDKAPDANPVEQTYLVIHTDQLAASIDNNVILYERTRAQTTENSGYKSYGIWNAPWTYRGADDQALELPWCNVIITDDRNGDGQIDWQDGAIAFREQFTEPVGAEDIRNSLAYISFNGGSIAISPFLRALEDAKQLSLMIDGFGQMIQFKGYQSEGHDAAHPDCAGNYNRRAGGMKELQTLFNYAAEYNLIPGVHINVSESYPEAKNFSDAILRVPHQGGWSWYDSALRMDYDKDIISGNLYKRLDQMKAELPALRWIYVDVYGGHYGNDPWVAHKLANKLNANGWLVGTEYFGPMERQLLWAHHLYAVPDTKLVRFIKNNMADTFKQHPLLKGTTSVGIGGWDNNYNFNKVVQAFYNENLPTKYMQNFPILRWADSRIDFEDGVHVENSNGWKLYRNGKLLSDGQTMLIPWDPKTEIKAYHWNSRGGATTWDVPASWANKSRVKLYQLTRLGRKAVADLNVSAGKITIEAEANTPYVVYLEEPKPTRIVWGEGGPLLDPSFTSGTFDVWEKSSSTPNTNHITIEVDGDANAMLTVNAAKKSGADATVRQVINGLTGGKSYSASVWVNVTEGRKAWIGVQPPGTSGAKNWVDRTDLTRSEGRLKFRGTTFQRLAVTFDVPAGETKAMLFLRADAGTAASTAQFDDVRVVELPGKTPQGRHVLFEDFENVDEHWGPFVSAGNTDHVHLSESNPGYTKDTINGQFSLKNMNEGTSGEIYRTVQSTLKLEPNTRYRIGFAYLNQQANFHVAVKTKDGGAAAIALDEAIPDGEGNFTATFTTGKFTDYYVAFQTEKSHGHVFVIDDFFIDRN